MLRALVISLLILCTVAATLPLADSFGDSPQAAAVRAQRQRRLRRHSRAWWRRHRRLVRRRRARAARRARLRALAAQGRAPEAKRDSNPVAIAAEAHALLTPALRPLALPAFVAKAALPVVAVEDVPPPATVAAAAALAPAPAPPRRAVAPQWPSAWRSLAGGNVYGELRFAVRGTDGQSSGAVTWTRVAAAAAAAPGATPLARAKSLGNVPLTELRRKVIDRMLAEGGWVVNDFERELGGQRTFVVVAESAPANGARLAWVFYFTSFNGQIYALTTSARTGDAAALAADAEHFLAALNNRARGAQTAQR
ncbi:MAG TPA: hypothetical protein VF546_11165 [Pyrinomonadaceae bacterium]|jgi:hypothetical protein